MIRNCQALDAPQVCEIYNHYVLSTVTTFEEVPVTDDAMALRISDIAERLPWLVWEDNGRIAGFAYAAPWKSRSAYRFSVETTVYVAEASARRGIGTQLYQALLGDLRRRNVHCAIGAIALPNPASIAFHEKLGFSKIGELREVGWKLGRWVDVGYWELVLGASRLAGR
ncbi:MAG: GNAT family N-acetyltransferase [Lysobacterales bacterium]|jgi:phosphinothricin acetyltransferase